MSPTPSQASSSSREAGPTPAWLLDLLGVDSAAEDGEVTASGQQLVMRGGILRERSLLSDAQAQTSEAFGFKWAKRDTFESEASLRRMHAWLVERYGDVPSAPWWSDYGDDPLLLDAGCGAGMSGLALLGPKLDQIRYLGADVSTAVEVAAQRFAEAGHRAGFIQADITALPLPEGSVDVIFSEGVLHHTDSTEGALKSLAPLLRPGGRFLLYVYRRKGPVREFTDDHVRAALQGMEPKAAWAALEPLTRLGIALGELEVDVDVPEDIELLGIPAGKIDLQRLFYWHVAKAYYDPELSLDEMNHINYDWYAPRNAHRQTADEVRRWCEEAGLDIEREDVQEAGITVTAVKGRP